MKRGAPPREEAGREGAIGVAAAIGVGYGCGCSSGGRSPGLRPGLTPLGGVAMAGRVQALLSSPRAGPCGSPFVPDCGSVASTRSGWLVPKKSTAFSLPPIPSGKSCCLPPAPEGSLRWMCRGRAFPQSTRGTSRLSASSTPGPGFQGQERFRANRRSRSLDPSLRCWARLRASLPRCGRGLGPDRWLPSRRPGSPPSRSPGSPRARSPCLRPWLLRGRSLSRAI